MNDECALKAPIAVYQEFLAKGQLAYQYSVGAERPVFYPRLLCPFTGTAALEWRISAGYGTIYSLSVVSRRGHPDHCVVLVDIDEGFRMMSRVDGVPADQVKIGMRVKARIEQSDPDWDQPHPTFELEDATCAN